jgi:hypothetical protein
MLERASIVDGALEQDNFDSYTVAVIANGEPAPRVAFPQKMPMSVIWITSNLPAHPSFWRRASGSILGQRRCHRPVSFGGDLNADHGTAGQLWLDRTSTSLLGIPLSLV